MSGDIALTPLTVAIAGFMEAKDALLCDYTAETRAACVTAWGEVVSLWPPHHVSEHVIEYSPEMGIAHAKQLREWIRTDPECAQAYACDLAMLQDLYDEIEAAYLLEANGDSHD